MNMVVDKVVLEYKGSQTAISADYLVKTKGNKYFRFKSLYDLNYVGLTGIELRKNNQGSGKTSFLYLKFKGDKFVNRDVIDIHEIKYEDVLNDILLNT